MLKPRREIVEAGAGCGKTTGLVARYLEALSGPKARRPSEVLALTFTVEAATQMRSRVLEALEKSDHENLIEAVLEESQIGNFHSLCLRLVQPRLHELGYEGGLVPPAVARLERERHVLRLLGEEPQAEELLRSLSPSDILEQAHQLWFSAELLKPSTLPLRLQEIRATWERFVEKAQSEGSRVLGEYAAKFASAKNPWVPAYLRALETLEPADVKAFAFRGLPFLKEHEAEFLQNARAFKNFFKHRWPDSLRPAALEAQIQLDARLRDFLARAVAQGPRLLDFAALEAELLRLLEQEQSLGRRLLAAPKTLLVDEFQDTNRTQHRILELLSDEHTEWYFVGDPKQSIYAFRGGDVSLFIELRERLQRLGLDTNWRSHPSLLSFANGVQGRLFNPASPLDPPAQTLRVSPEQKKFLSDSLSSRLRVEQHPAKTDLFPAFLAAYRRRANELGPAATHGALFSSWKELRTFAAGLRQAGVPFSISGAENFLDHLLSDVFCDWLDSSQDPSLESGPLALQRWNLPADSRPDAALFPPPELVPGSLDWIDLMASFCSQLRPARFERGREWVAAMERLLKSLQEARMDFAMTSSDLATFLRKRAASLDASLDFLQEKPQGGGLRLLTLHGSKGLEFDAVYLPQLYERQGSARPGSLEDDEGLSLALSLYDAHGRRVRSLAFQERLLARKALEEAEKKRLFYVALTRAERSLDIFLHSPGKITEDESGLGVLGWARPESLYWNRVLCEAYASGDFAELEAAGELSWQVFETAAETSSTQDLRVWTLPADLAPVPTAPDFYRMGVSAYLSRNEELFVAAAPTSHLAEAAPNFTEVGTRLHALLEVWDGSSDPVADALVKAAAISLRKLLPLEKFWRDLQLRPERVLREFGLFLHSEHYRLSGFADVAWFVSDEELVLIDWKSSASLTSLRRPERLEKIRSQLKLYASGFRAHYACVRGMAVGIELSAAPTSALLFDEIL